MANSEWENLLRLITRGTSRESSNEGSVSTMMPNPSRTTAPLDSFMSGAAAALGFDSGAPDDTLRNLTGLVSNIVPTGSGTSGTAGGGILSSIASKFALSPIISGLLRLFGGSEPEPPPVPARFALPNSIVREAGYSRRSGGEVQLVDHGEGGAPRVASNNLTSSPAITIQVQAMDSKSFLDHSESIARAVREAMLHSHSLNDVISEL